MQGVIGISVGPTANLSEDYAPSIGWTGAIDFRFGAEQIVAQAPRWM